MAKNCCFKAFCPHTWSCFFSLGCRPSRASGGGPGWWGCGGSPPWPRPTSWCWCAPPPRPPSSLPGCTPRTPRTGRGRRRGRRWSWGRAGTLRRGKQWGDVLLRIIGNFYWTLERTFYILRELWPNLSVLIEIERNWEISHRVILWTGLISWPSILRLWLFSNW